MVEPDDFLLVLLSFLVVAQRSVLKADAVVGLGDLPGVLFIGGDVLLGLGRKSLEALRYTLKQ